MAEMTYREAVRQAIDEEMERDERVFLMGEEVARYNGAYKVSMGLWEKYGDMRVVDTPITEAGFAGVGIGAAMAGLRPIVEFMTWNFAFLAMDQIVNNAATMRYMSGGQFTLPIVFRGPNGPAEYLAAQHSHNVAAFYTHVPGLKVVCPSTPYDAKGLLKSAIRDDNPVIVLEGEMMYNWKGDVPEEEYVVPIGQAAVRREGRDVTIVSFGRPMKIVMEAAEVLAGEGIEADVVDLRSLRPMDSETLVRSVMKTNRCVVVDESWPVCSVGSQVGQMVSNRCFDRLDAPVEVVSLEDVPMPYNHRLESAVVPSVEKIVRAVRGWKLGRERE
ncbi:MAG: pyruvate dehydrogenase complex E1 component subunit beta [Phycisphaerae bacterium]|nr:pyruvate dehydrogenase complex E1 component subunit beta [Phycisphaerae bacterium]